MSRRLNLDLIFFNRHSKETASANENTLKNYQLICLDLLEQQRKLLNEMNRHAEFDEELIRKHLSFTDLEEYRLRENLVQKVDLD